MSRRVGQNGSVFVKAACKSGTCGHSICPKYGRVWKDVPGQAERQRVCISLGKITTTAAERKLRQQIIDLKIDSAETFERANSEMTTFRIRSRQWPCHTIYDE